MINWCALCCLLYVFIFLVILTSYCLLILCVVILSPDYIHGQVHAR